MDKLPSLIERISSKENKHRSEHTLNNNEHQNINMDYKNWKLGNWKQASEKVEAAQITGKTAMWPPTKKHQAQADKEKSSAAAPGRPRRKQQTNKDQQKRRQTGREASRQTDRDRQRPAETPANWQKSQQANKEQQNHKLAKKTIHQRTISTQKQKNIELQNVSRETIANNKGYPNKNQ